MNNRALTLSLVMAVMAIFFVQSYVSSIEEEAKKKFGTEVLSIVAKRDIKEMETINETLLEFKNVPKRFLEPAAIAIEKKENSAESQKTLKSLAGTIAIVPIKKGEQLTFNKITEPSMRTGLSPQIAPGRRAISIPVNELTGVSKLLKAGDRVDIIALLDGGGGKKETRIAKTILQDIPLLSVGRSVTNNAPRIVDADSTGRERVTSLVEDFSFSSVTLEVSPIDAQMLALLLSTGDAALTLTLRNNDDSEHQAVPSTILSDIISLDINRFRAAAPPRR
jgi:pilus assembly protein CpaB